MPCWFFGSYLEFNTRSRVIPLEEWDKGLFSWLNVAISGILELRRYSASAWVGAGPLSEVGLRARKWLLRLQLP